MDSLIFWLDPVFIGPYRLLAQPLGAVAAFLLGTAVWALAAVLLGNGTMRLWAAAHKTRLDKYASDMRKYHDLGEVALHQGNKEGFKAVNAQAQEAFGYHFSLNGAFFVASLWPVPVVMAWLELRFGQALPELPFDIFWIGQRPSVLCWFLVCYIPLRMVVGKYLPVRPAKAPVQVAANASDEVKPC